MTVHQQDPYSYSSYLLRKQFFKLFGGAFRIFNPSGDLTFFAQMKAFKLKEDVSVYTDEAKMNEVLRIKARSIIDFSAAYDVFDSPSGDLIGTLKRRGFKSMLKDEWVIMGPGDSELGLIREDSLIMALIRRFVTNLIPQTFHGEIRGTEVFKFRQHFNPFVQKLDLDFTSDRSGLLDRRMGIAAAVLLCAVEGRQTN